MNGTIRIYKTRTGYMRNSFLTWIILGSAIWTIQMVPAKASNTAQDVRPEILINVDFFDSIATAGHYYGTDRQGPKEIDELFKNCKESGASMVFWRCYSQIANYPSKLNYNMAQVHEIRSAPDDRRSEGAFAAKVGVKSHADGKSGGISQKINVQGSARYVFSGDINSNSPGAFLAIVDPVTGAIIISSETVISAGKFARTEIMFEYSGPFLACVLSKGSSDIHTFITDNLSLKTGDGTELLKNGGMEKPYMLKPESWIPINACFLTLNGDYKSVSPENRKKYFPNGDAIFNMLRKPHETGWAKNTMESCDTLAEAVKCAKKYGLKIYAWIDPVDEGRIVLPPLTGWMSKYCEEHPEYRAATIDGRTHWGMLCFGYPEVRKHKTEIIKELLAYGVDGIALKMSYQHNQCWDGNQYDYKEFLFNNIALKEYERIKGKPKNGDYDISLLQIIYGNFFMEWLKEIKPVMEASGKRLCLFEAPSKYLDNSYGSWKVDPVKIVDAKLVDDLLIEPRYNSEYKNYFSLLDSIAGYSAACRRNNVRLGFDFYLNGLMESRKNIKDKGAYMEDQLCAVAEEPVDFIGVYEAMYLDWKKLWPYVKQAHNRINAPDFKRKGTGDYIFTDEMKNRCNVASYASGASAVLKTADRMANAVEIIDDDISDGSACTVNGVPFDIEISLNKPETIDALRIYPSRVSYAHNPSGESGPKSFRVQGFSNNKWFDLFPPEEKAPRLQDSKDKSLANNWICKFPPVMVEKIRLHVTASNDTGRRMNMGDNPVIPDKNKVVFIREIQAFKTAK